MVVFPEPEGPRIAANSLFLKVIDTSFNATWVKSAVLYDFLICFSFNIINIAP
jgi:hypothetical protein